MSSVHGRTQKDIVDYIRTHSKDGKLTKSLLAIAKDIGYSNATIHRTLQSLQEKGVIEITPSEKPTEPNTILYKGSEQNEIDEFLAKGVQLSEEVEGLGNRIHDFLQEANLLMRKLHQQVEENSLDNRILHTQDVPGADIQILTVRKQVQ